MRIAVVDVGTNTTRLYIADVSGDEIVAEVTRGSRVTRLGAGVDSTGRLSNHALAREHSVLEEFREVIHVAKPQKAIAVMTSAVRDATNGAEFAHDVGRRFFLEPYVLTGDDEAKLTYLGATDTLDSSADDRILVFDIGGGSTEIVIGRGPELEFHVSTQAGVVRQAERHIHSDPVTASEIEAIAQDVRKILRDAVPEDRRTGIDRVLGVAGTPTSLAAIAQQLQPYDSSRVHGYRLSSEQRDTILAQLSAMTLEQRKHVPGLHPDRALAIVPGIVILTEVMKLFDLDAIEVSEHDILRGAALYFAAH